jgi:3-oxoacyl-[acyl-carrier protein] reductase
MTVVFDLSGKTAVVTGGANGIGRAVAERLSSSGAHVWVWDMAPVTLQGIDSVLVDVACPDQIAAAVSRTIDRTSGIDILVNSAGYLGAYVTFEQLAPEDQRRILEVNLVGTLEVCRQVLPHMRRVGRGRVVNMGSLAGKEGLRHLSVYSAASAGVIAFTKALAKDLADTGIRVNCVAPGPIETDLIMALGPEIVATMIASSPLKRLGNASEVAELIVWLCSDACSFNTGAVFDMSGGRATY